MNIYIINVIEDMKKAKRLLNYENGLLTSDLVESYIEKMSQYKIYCKENKQNRWTFLLRKYVNAAGYIDDETIYNYLYSFECAGNIMKVLNENNSLEEFNNLIKSQNHTEDTLFIVGQLLIEFSIYGDSYTNYILNVSESYFKYQVKEYQKKLNPSQRINIIRY